MGATVCAFPVSIHGPIAWQRYPNFLSGNHPWFSEVVPSHVTVTGVRPIQHTAHCPWDVARPGLDGEQNPREGRAPHAGVAQLVECQLAPLTDMSAIAWPDPSWKEGQQLREQGREREGNGLPMPSFGLLNPAAPNTFKDHEPFATVAV